MVFLPGNKTSSGNSKLYKSLGSLIKDYRQWRKLSQETIAESIGVSVRELRNWEVDRYRARIENLHDLSEATGIPMQVCVALNADQPIWYSLCERRFAYSSFEMSQVSPHDLLIYREQFDDRILKNFCKITSDKHIRNILLCHQEIYGTRIPLRMDVIKAASMILPDLNFIIFDSWGHYVGHLVCLPIKKDVYEQIKKRESFESYLTTEKISDIIALHEGVFFSYSVYSSNVNIGYSMLINSYRYYFKIKQKERYSLGIYVSSKQVEQITNNLGMRKVREYRHMHPNAFPSLYEIELDVMVNPLGPLGVLRWMIEEHDKRVESKNLTGENESKGVSIILDQETNNVRRPYNKKYLARTMDHLAVDSPLNGDNSFFYLHNEERGNNDAQERGETQQVYDLKMEACPNPKCTLYSKPGKGNIVSNGSRRTKEGALTRRFLCKECGKSFCSRDGTIFYGLRSSEENVLKALKLLIEGMPLRGVAKILGVKRDTARHWLRVAFEQSGKIDAMLKKELDVPQVGLDTLWTFVKSNSLRQRATLWRGRKSNSGF